MTSFSFATAGRIVFGAGCAADLPGIVAGLGRTVLVCTGADPERFAAVTAGLGTAGRWPTAGEPTVDDIRRGVAFARSLGVDVVVGIGGGAVLDAAKLIAALVPDPEDILDHLEVIGGGRPLTVRPLPFVAVPTTAGTGSEVTANGVVASPEHGVKVSLRSADMLADVALVDPELTLGCPSAVTASSGLDALTQCLEAYVTPFATPLTDGLCVEGLRRAGSGLRRAHADGSDLTARTDMSLCALLSGIALANAKLGAVHGFAAVIGGLTGAPHGAVCASLLVACCRGTIDVLQETDPGHPSLARYAHAGELLSGTAGVEPLLAWLTDTVALLQIPTLADLGIGPERYDEICAKAAVASSMKGNPVTLDDAQLHLALQRSATATGH